MKMLKNLLKKISIYLSFYYFTKTNYNKKKHNKIESFVKKKINKYFLKNPRLLTHKILSKEISKIINKNNLNSFLRNTILQNIFFIHNRFFIFNELSELKKDKKWKLWKNILKENDIGNPIRYFLYPQSSGNRIRQVYILKNLLDHSKIFSIKEIKSVIELGGGYGCMAQIFYNLNSKTKYSIYDMYEVNLLQHYYLKMNNCKTSFESKARGIKLINKLNYLKSLTSKKNNDLFIANWSLSEFPLKFRNEFVSTIKGSKYSIICFQEKFENIDNLKFFLNLVKKLKSKFNSKLIDFTHYNRSPFNNTKHHMLILEKK